MAVAAPNFSAPKAVSGEPAVTLFPILGAGGWGVKIAQPAGMKSSFSPNALYVG